MSQINNRLNKLVTKLHPARSERPILIIREDDWKSMLAVKSRADAGAKLSADDQVLLEQYTLLDKTANPNRPLIILDDCWV